MRIANIKRRILKHGKKGRAIILPAELYPLLNDSVEIVRHNEDTRTITIKY